MAQTTLQKLSILADAAKYDVSCSSGGSNRKNTATGIGNSTEMGICHTYTQDGRCVSLLKILLTNHCIYDCAYCISRRSNDVKRAAFTIQEVVDLIINFYKRNYIEGLFLSSGIFRNADYTMERLVRIVKKLRSDHQFNGYIHLKAIPGASKELLYEAGLYADRLSVNIEMPSEKSLKRVAPEKSFGEALQPMGFLKEFINESLEEQKKSSKAPKVAPAGQSTQMIIGASEENDFQILTLSDQLYSSRSLKRVYFSGYVPVSEDKRLPVIHSTPVIRENRLYQADWLMRFYGFKVNELVNEHFPELDLSLDPKAAYAIRNRHLFPVDIQTAGYYKLIRVPGIGPLSARRILEARKSGTLREHQLIKMGVSWKKARHFALLAGNTISGKELSDQLLKNELRSALQKRLVSNQLPLF